MEELTIVGRKGCSRCKITCNFCTQMKIPFSYVDIETLTANEVDDIMNKAEIKGIREFPILFYRGEIIKSPKEIIE